MKLLLRQLYILDARVFVIFAQRTHNIFLLRLFRLASRSADGYFYPLISAALLLLGNPYAFALLKAGLFAFALELPIYGLIKNGVKRPRPCDVLNHVRRAINPPDQFSFPSGHTAAAFIIACLLSYFFPFLSLPIFAWAIVVGMSRVYLGVHYPTDVVVGMLLGISCALFSINFII